MSMPHTDNSYLVNDIMHGNVAWPSMTSLECKIDACTDALSSSMLPNHNIHHIFHSISHPQHRNRNRNNHNHNNNSNNNNALISYAPQPSIYCYSQSNISLPHFTSTSSTNNAMTCSECNQLCHCEQNNSNINSLQNQNTNTFTINTLNTITLQHKTEVDQLNETISICKNELARIHHQKVEQERQIKEQQSKIQLLLQKTQSSPYSSINYKGKCPTMHLSYEIIKKYLKVPCEFMDSANDRCYCDNCHHMTRNERTVSLRGNPPLKYCPPLGWVRFGLTIDEGKCKMNNVFHDWHIAFHGTNRETAQQIFKSGLNLLKPGDYTIDGLKLSISEGHIRDCIWRRNLYSNQNEWFDPNQIFVTPSIVYASNDIYAKPFYCFNNTLKVQCAFQLRIRPNCYGIGQETINATKHGHVVDDMFSNNELEWYTKENVGIVVYALLVKITSVNNESNNEHNPMYIDLT